MKIEKRFFHGSIARRIFALFVLAAFFPMMVMVVLTFIQVRSIFTEQAISRLMVTSKDFALAVDQRLIQMQADLSEIAMFMRDDGSVPSSQVLENLKGLYSGLTVIGPGALSTPLIGKALSWPAIGESERAHLAKGESVLIVQSDLGSSPRMLLLHMIDADQPNNFALVAELDPAQVWGVEEDFPYMTGLCMFADSGVMLFCSRPELQTESAMLARKIADPPPDPHVQIGEEPWIMGQWQLFLKPKFHESYWTAIAVQPTAAVFRPIEKFSRIFIGAIVLALLLVVLLSILQIRRTMGPLERLITGTRRFAYEDFDHRVIVVGHDEFGELATSFNDMAERLGSQLGKIKQLAFYDSLTGLPNRRLLIDRLHQAFASSARSSRKGALLFIDLDNFKDINDTLGHDIGDLLLQQTAQRIESCLREVDTVARLGGDEFVVVLEDLSEHVLEAAAQTKAVGEKILATLSQPYQLAAHEYHSTASIGAAIFSDHDKTGEELLKRADIAMYQAKKAGRNTLRFFDPQMQENITTRVSMESALRLALEMHQFHLYYQIQVDSSHRPLGAEALIRWIHPIRGMISPAQFIPLAEKTGLILPIGQWVLDTACTQLKAWQQDALTRDLVLAVNVSAKQFRQADFVAQVQAAVQRHAINPMRLKLELTESMLLDNIEDTIATMNALKKIGVQFSLDDFGTGYSSLQYLKRLPLDQLKIDQSFVRDIGTDSSDKAIVSTIIAMAQSLNLEVIAEGVETEEQRQFLLDEGCTHYQGYLFSKPVPIEQFEALLKQG
jgi:diguanylate cyclase (GGDEF)-like protein